MDKVYEQLKDLHVAGVYIYKKANDAYAYSDSATTAKIAAADLKDMFLKGVYIISGDNIYKPTGLLEDDGVVTLTYVTADATTASTAVLATLVSKEYTA